MREANRKKLEGQNPSKNYNDLDLIPTRDEP